MLTSRSNLASFDKNEMEVEVWLHEAQSKVWCLSVTWLLKNRQKCYGIFDNLDRILRIKLKTTDESPDRKTCFSVARTAGELFSLSIGVRDSKMTKQL